MERREGEKICVKGEAADEIRIYSRQKAKS